MRRWLPAIVWSAAILLASFDLFSASHSGGMLQRIILAVLGRPLDPETFARLHFLIRKASHVTEYAIASALYFRALTKRRALGAIALAALLASVDEFHQSFVPSRTGTPADVLIDVAGATLAQLLIAIVTAWRNRRREAECYASRS